jgi:TraM recognition site of TraD and TraG/Helicase HerA, central domain
MTYGQGQVALGIGVFLLTLSAPFMLGVFGVRALRWAGLRWSWALLGVPISWAAWSVELWFGLFFGVATVTAVWLGARGHREAVLHGGEEAREAQNSPGPLRWAWGRVRCRHARRVRLANAGLALGAARGGGVCRVPFGASRGVHAIVLGATGSGKTVTQAAIAEAYVLAGAPAIVLDPKGDGYLREVLREAAEQSGAEFREWSPDGASVYNPLGRGGPTEIADKALAGHRWTEPHYEVATQRLLGHVLATMQAAQIWPPSLCKVARQMELGRLDALAKDLGGKRGERTREYLDGLSARAKADLAGGRDRLAVLAEGELGPRLDPALGNGEELDLRASILAGDVVYFDLDADRYPAASKLLGAALTIDLVGLTADLQGAGVGGLLVIDEFAALAAEQVCRLFGRARSAGLSVLLGAQSLADLRAVRLDDPTDTLTEQVLCNVEYTVAHRIGDPDSAERLARVAGGSPAWSTTQRISGRGAMMPEQEGSRTRGRELALFPDQFKRLGVGEAVVINPKAKRFAQIVRMWPPGKGLEGGQDERWVELGEKG